MPGKMNLMYVGVDNPFDFAVSGFNAKDIEPIIEVFPETARHLKCNLKKLTNGSYTIKIPKGVKGVKINALAKIGNDRKMLKGDAPYFRVKSLPDPIAYVSGFESNQLVFEQNDIPSLKGLSAKFPNFDFEVKAKIISFQISQLMSKEETKTEKAPLYNHLNSGNKFDNKVLTSLESVKELTRMLKDAGIDNKSIDLLSEFESKYIIENIMAELPGGSIVRLAPINFKIINHL